MNKFIEFIKSHKILSCGIVTLLIVAIILVIAIPRVTTNQKAETAKTKVSIQKETSKVYDKAGTYSDKVTLESAEITASGVTLENATITDLVIAESVGEGEVTLNNCNVANTFVINGGGSNSVKINGGKYKEIINNKYNCHIVVGKNTSVATLTTFDTAKLDVYGKIDTANIIESDYTGEVTWEVGVNVLENGVITTLNVPEDKDIEVVAEKNDSIASQKTMDESKVNAIKQQTSTVSNNVSNNVRDNVTAPSNTGNTNSNVAPQNTNQPNSAASNNQGGNSASNVNTNTNKPSAGNNGNNVPTQRPKTVVWTNVSEPVFGDVYVWSNQFYPTESYNIPEQWSNGYVEWTNGVWEEHWINQQVTEWQQTGTKWTNTKMEY